MIGKTIKSILVGNSALTNLVPASHMFPYVADSDTDFPVIIYTVNSVEPEYTKMGWANDTDIFSINVFHKDYSSLQTINTAVRAAFENNKTAAASQDITRIIMIGFREGYDLANDAFGSELIFQTKVNDY